MLKRTLFALTLVVSFFASSANADPLLVGFIGGLTGPGKSYGEAAKNGLEMGLEAAGAINVQVIYEDDEFSPAKTVTAFKKLTEIDKVALVIVLASSPSKAIAPLAEQKKIPLIAWASDTEVAKNRKFVFRSWVSGEAEAVRLADEVKKRAYKNTAFLIATTDYGRSVRDGFKKHVPPALLLADEEYPADARDFKPFLTGLRAKKVESLGICLNPGQSGLLVKQATELGMSFKIFGCETLEDKNEVALSQGKLVGSWFVTAGVSDAFHAAYIKRIGNDDVLSGAAIHKDIGTILADLSKGPHDAEQLAAALRRKKISDGATGNFEIKTTADDQFFDIHLVLKEITADGFKAISG